MNFSPRKWKICKSRESRVQGIGRLIVEKMARLTFHGPEFVIPQLAQENVNLLPAFDVLDKREIWGEAQQVRYPVAQLASKRKRSPLVTRAVL